MTNGTERGARLTLEGMYKELEAMCERQEVLWAEHESLTQDREVLEQAIGVLERRAAKNGQESPPVAAHLASPAAVSLDGCGNNGQRLARMAEAWGGVVNCNDAADLLLSLGISNGKRSNLVSALHQHMAGKDSLWEYASPRTYRYRPYQGTHNGAGGDTAESGPD